MASYIRAALTGLIVAAAGSIASASPIHLEDDAESKFPHELTSEQMQILDELADHGWHLGWFKENAFDPSFLGNELGNIIPPNGELVGTLLPVTEQLGRSATAAGASAQIAAVPEPGTLLLLGGGIAGIAAKVRSRRRRTDIGA